MSQKLHRRQFVQFATGGILGAGASGLGLRGISSLNSAIQSEEVIPPGGPESWVPGICSLCPAGCGLRVRRIGNRAVKVQGNPLHPVNHGGLCPKGPAALQELYHPDRLRSPMKNVGSRTAPKWREISWEEAVATLTAKLRQLLAARQPHTVALVDGQGWDLASHLLRRFLAVYGSANYFTMPSGLDASQVALYLQQGVTQPVAYDWERTRYLLSFGVDLLEGWGSPATIMRAFGRWRDSAEGRSTKFVQIEPRFSVTAAKADEWVSLRPGTDAALALGIAYVLITEDLYDARFVREHTFGFEDWRDDAGREHMGFRSLVLSDYRLEDVSEFTGVPPETILRVAREFGRNRPALAIGDRQTSTLAGDPYAAMAVHSLNAMAGSIDAPGGVLLQADLPLSRDEVSDAGGHLPLVNPSGHLFPGAHLARVPEAILSRRPYAVQAVLLHEADPVFALPNGAAFRDALAQVPFVAAFTAFENDTSVLADLVLPAPTGLEKWHGAFSPPTFAQPLVSVAAPVIPPRHRTRNPADVILEVARAIGGGVAAALPFAGFEEYLKSHVRQVHAAQTGAVFSSGMEENWNRLLERSGWWAPTYSTPEELWTQMKEHGGWWDPAYPYGEWERVFRTPSGRFEFYSQALAAWAAKHPEPQLNEDRRALPHQPRLEPAPQDGALLLIPIEVLPLAGGSGGHLPYLQQIAGQHLEAAWESWLEINPRTAAKLGIADGDPVWVEARRTRVRVRARCFEGARPEVVHLPLGYGHGSGSAWARRGVNPLDLLEARHEPLAGLPRSTAFVRVYPAPGPRSS